MKNLPDVLGNMAKHIAQSFQLDWAIRQALPLP
jgi:hypothetical protein